MSNDEGTEPFPPVEDQFQPIDQTVARKQKKPRPEIDFTIHTMEDGAQVNTQERVCKGTWRYSSVSFVLPLGLRMSVDSLSHRSHNT